MRVVLAPGALALEPDGVPLTGPDASRWLDAGGAARALAAGWGRARPADALVLHPLPDGGPGTAAALPDGLVAGRRVLTAPGALGRGSGAGGPDRAGGPGASRGEGGGAEEREIGLVRLRPTGPAGPIGQGRPTGSGGPGDGTPATPSTWFLDAASLLSLPEDRALAGRHARHGSSAGLGTLLARALAVVPAQDTLAVGLGRAAVHDGGAGLVEALGGVEAAGGLLSGRDLLLALADDVPLGGMSGAGAGLADVTDLGPEQAQELDRAACAVASHLAREAAAVRAARPGHGGGAPRALPLAGSDAGGGTTGSELSVTSWGTGAAGGAVLVLRALGARAQAGARVLAALTGLGDAVGGADLVVTAAGEVFDVLADSAVAVVGEAAQAEALPVVLVAGRAAVPRGELAEAGVVSSYQLADAVVSSPVVGAGEWADGGGDLIAQRLDAMGERLARTWSPRLDR